MDIYSGQDAKKNQKKAEKKNRKRFRKPVRIQCIQLRNGIPSLNPRRVCRR